jgi:hypothetical protein
VVNFRRNALALLGALAGAVVLFSACSSANNPPPAPFPPTAAPTYPAYALGGASSSATFKPSSGDTIALGTYQNISSLQLIFPATTASSSFQLAITDGLDDGDIAPASFPPDDVTTGATTIVYFKITNATSGSSGSFGSTAPGVTVTDTNSLSAYGECSFDGYAKNNGSFAWFRVAPTVTPSAGTVTFAPFDLSPGTVSIPNGKPFYAAISCS